MDLSEVLYDTDLGSQQVTVYRKTGAFQAGVFVEQETPVTVTAIILPASEQEAERWADADRIAYAITVLTDQRLFPTHLNDGQGNAGTGDEVLYQGYRYRVRSVAPWGDVAAYWKATAVYMPGD